MSDPQRGADSDARPGQSVDLGEIPGELAAALRRGLGRHRDVPVRDAATVVLLRDGAHGLEVLVQRRVRAMTFAAGMTVFPGGAVEAGDEASVPWSAPVPAGLPARLGAAAERAEALVVAAVRETFEEVGILVAAAGSATAVPPGDQDAWRQRLERGEATLGDLLRAGGLALDPQALQPWAIWVTPVGEPQRYDTRFFLARVPDSQQLRRPASEAESAWWAAPAQLLAAVTRGELAMLPPTRQTLLDLAAFSRVEEAMAAAREHPVRRFRPEFAVDPASGALRGTLWIEQPADPGEDPGRSGPGKHGSPGAPGAPD